MSDDPQLPPFCFYTHHVTRLSQLRISGSGNVLVVTSLGRWGKQNISTPLVGNLMGRENDEDRTNLPLEPSRMAAAPLTQEHDRLL